MRFTVHCIKINIIPILLFFGLVLVPVKNYGQNINLRFQHFTTDNGLSQNTVDCILKDSRGFMWFGTWNGLSRFDGYTFVVYRSDNQPNSLSNNFIYSLCEDKFNNIWIGTKNGLNKFNFKLNTFKRYNQKNTINGLPDNNISSVICTKKGKIWIGTAKGLAKLEFINTDSIKITDCTNKLPQNFRNIPVTTIFEDKDETLWVGTINGLISISSDGEQINSYIHHPENNNSLTYSTINSIYQDKTGELWIGTQFGLNRFNIKGKKFTRYYYNADYENSISHFVINDIKEDVNGTLLVATLGGLNKYNRKSDNFDSYPINLNDDYSLNNQFINSLFTDKEGNVWIGTDKGGVNKYSIYQKQFGYIMHDPSNKNSISNNTINSIFEEGEDLWIGTAGGGLNLFNKLNRKVINFSYNPHNTQGINNNFITSINRDKNQNFWVGTWGGGLNRLVSEKGTGLFTKYITSTDSNSICDVYISSVCPDSREFLVIGALGGLDLFYYKQNKFKHIANNKNWKNRITEVGCILLDSRGYYWIGTRIGLFRIPSGKIDGKLTDSDIERYVYNDENSNSISGNYIIALLEDHSGNIWAGTYGNGLCKIEIDKSGSVDFKNFTTAEGLANNVVYSILEDDKFNLWLSTDNGLSRFDVSSHVFKNFYVTDGLQSNQFYWSAGYKGIHGRMYFGGIKGVNFFNPDSIKDYPFQPTVVLTDLKIFNRSVNVGSLVNKREILDSSLLGTKQLSLTYRENVFSFEFSALDYYLPEKIVYYYMMEGVDNEWVKVTSDRRFASYTNLKGGEYIFKVKARNSDGLINDKATILKISIRPPFYETIWFRIIGILALIFGAVGYYQYRTQKLQSRKRILEKLVTERTEQIEKQKIQLELQNKEISEQRDKLIELNKRVQLVNQLKLRFFTNISHEFRTPITLILGPLEKLIQSWNGDDIARETLLMINRNAQRLLHLINQLMEFRKIETGKQEIKVSAGNFDQFMENIFQSFSQLAKQRKINYVLHSSEIKEDTYFDHEKIENVLFNLLSNAFKYTPESGSIQVSYEIIRQKNESSGISVNTKMLSVSISDTGIGIEKEHLNNIFKRFYRINTPDNFQVKGTGIGLSLTRELIKAHKGNISVESTLGSGTTFNFQIPFTKESFSVREIFSSGIESKNNFESQIEALSEELKAADAIRNTVPEENDSTQKPTLLIVEDNFDLRSFISHSLSVEYHIIEAENGKQGLEYARSYSPELVISDIMMPEMDGLELCTKLKDGIQTSHIPVILLTAKSAVENWVEGFETGADDYIAKPFNIEVLKARAKNLIESRKELRKLFSRNSIIEPAKLTTSSADEQFLSKALSIVEENYIDPEFTVEKFIDKMAVSRSLLHKKLSALTDMSAGDFITTVRLKKSVLLLQNKDGNISEIAYHVGFNDPKYFSRIFKKHYGVTPTEFSNQG